MRPLCMQLLLAAGVCATEDLAVTAPQKAPHVTPDAGISGAAC